MADHGVILDEKLQPDTKLYRYMSLSQFMFMVEKRETCLTSIRSWEDKWECPTSGIFKEHSHLAEVCGDADEDAGLMYGQCWSFEGVSDAMWKIYSPKNEGILLETSARKFSLISDIRYGMLSPVMYYNDLKQAAAELHNAKGTKRTFVRGLLKRYAFKHENEVRLIVMNNQRCLGRRHEECRHIRLAVNPLEFIEGIVIDPRASDWYVDTIRTYCSRAGFSFVPLKSDLYYPEVFHEEF